ncbi:hypothetical protein C8C99_0263 [Acidovorax sp. 107]|uniref:hypothetical protein n=1 Tax=Acidovorax sp. 107 TaxID=2135638 RepID=UPI000D4F8470|nr:hypothetical protein [Acidovorax sp. 107]PUA95463.1 hypothetical protein C8C99_0263 [Acidovorax sp. 107]
MSKPMSYWEHFKTQYAAINQEAEKPCKGPLSTEDFLREIGMTDEAQIKKTADDMRRIDTALFASYKDEQ